MSHTCVACCIGSMCALVCIACARMHAHLMCVACAHVHVHRMQCAHVYVRIGAYVCMCACVHVRMCACRTLDCRDKALQPASSSLCTCAYDRMWLHALALDRGLITTMPLRRFDDRSTKSTRGTCWQPADEIVRQALHMILDFLARRV